MKMTNKILGAVAIMAATAATSHAAIFDWSFATSPNPSTAVASSNPTGAVGTSTAAAGALGEGYEPGYLSTTASDLSPTQAKTMYGDRTGIWGVGGTGGQIALNIGAYAATPTTELTYTVKVTEFVGTSANIDLFPGAYTISGAPVGYTPPTGVTVGASGTEGSWRMDTWTFKVTPGMSPLSLTIAPLNQIGNSISVDAIQWTVDGDLSLVAVPEPMLATGLTAAGLVLFGLYRKSKKA